MGLVGLTVLISDLCTPRRLRILKRRDLRLDADGMFVGLLYIATVYVACRAALVLRELRSERRQVLLLYLDCDDDVYNTDDVVTDR